MIIGFCNLEIADYLDENNFFGVVRMKAQLVWFKKDSEREMEIVSIDSEYLMNFAVNEGNIAVGIWCQERSFIQNGRC